MRPFLPRVLVGLASAFLVGQPLLAEASSSVLALPGFTADPSIRVFGDTYYLYPAIDKPNRSTTEFVINLSGCILVMREGRLAGELSRTEASQDAVLRLMTGVQRQAAA